MEQKPELTVVLVDAFQNCVPENLGAVPGRKLLLVGDTHHGNTPLRTMLEYARQELFDRIILTHDPHHLHWFAEAGIAPTAYIPNVNCAYFPQRFIEQRQKTIGFVGQTENRWLRRRYLLQAIKDAGLPLIVREAPAAMAAAMYNSIQVTFNCSLNGDLNMRVFEVMAAGGFLLTDRLSPQAGLERLFRRGVDYADYEDLDDLLSKLRHYLAHPDECRKIARAGQKAYLKRHTPRQRVKDLLEFVYGKSIALPYNNDLRVIHRGDKFGENLVERVCLYEFFQSVARQNELVIVVADAAIGARTIADLVDLPRLKIKVTEPAEPSHIKKSLSGLGVLNQIEFIEAQQADADIQLVHASTIAGLPNSQSLRAQTLAVMTAGTSLDSQTKWLVSQGFSKFSETPYVFQRVH